MKHAPQELSQIGLNPSSFTYSDAKSWRGPCSSCGGTRRFVIFTENIFPLWFGYCDLCGTRVKAWEKVRVEYDPERAAVIEAENARREAERAEYRREKLAEFTTSEIWRELHERMAEAHIDYLESEGIPKGVQDYLHIGFTQEKKYYDKQKVLQSSPAFTFPWFGSDFDFLTMQYRLTDATDRRYIFENGLGGGQYYYMTEPDEPMRDKVIICEGAKKAIVTQFWLAPDDSYTVLAASSANTFGAALEATKDCGLRYIVMDPNTEYWQKKAVETNRQTTHSVRLPFKIDDGWKDYGLDRRAFTSILQNAI